MTSYSSTAQSNLRAAVLQTALAGSTLGPKKLAAQIRAENPGLRVTAGSVEAEQRWVGTYLSRAAIVIQRWWHKCEPYRSLRRSSLEFIQSYWRYHRARLQLKRDMQRAASLTAAVKQGCLPTAWTTIDAIYWHLGHEALRMGAKGDRSVQSPKPVYDPRAMRDHKVMVEGLLMAPPRGGIHHRQVRLNLKAELWLHPVACVRHHPFSGSCPKESQCEHCKAIELHGYSELCEMSNGLLVPEYRSIRLKKKEQRSKQKKQKQKKQKQKKQQQEDQQQEQSQSVRAIVRGHRALSATEMLRQELVEVNLRLADDNAFNDLNVAALRFGDLLQERRERRERRSSAAASIQVDRFSAVAAATIQRRWHAYIKGRRLSERDAYLSLQTVPSDSSEILSEPASEDSDFMTTRGDDNADSSSIASSGTVSYGTVSAHSEWTNATAESFLTETTLHSIETVDIPLAATQHLTQRQSQRGVPTVHIQHAIKHGEVYETDSTVFGQTRYGIVSRTHRLVVITDSTLMTGITTINASRDGQRWTDDGLNEYVSKTFGQQLEKDKRRTIKAEIQSAYARRNSAYNFHAQSFVEAEARHRAIQATDGDVVSRDEINRVVAHNEAVAPEEDRSPDPRIDLCKALKARLNRGQAVDIADMLSICGLKVLIAPQDGQGRPSSKKAKSTSLEQLSLNHDDTCKVLRVHYVMHARDRDDASIAAAEQRVRTLVASWPANQVKRDAELRKHLSELSKTCQQCRQQNPALTLVQCKAQASQPPTSVPTLVKGVVTDVDPLRMAFCATPLNSESTDEVPLSLYQYGETWRAAQDQTVLTRVLQALRNKGLSPGERKQLQKMKNQLSTQRSQHNKPNQKGHASKTLEKDWSVHLRSSPNDHATQRLKIYQLTVLKSIERRFPGHRFLDKQINT